MFQQDQDPKDVHAVDLEAPASRLAPFKPPAATRPHRVGSSTTVTTVASSSASSSRSSSHRLSDELSSEDDDAVDSESDGASALSVPRQVHGDAGMPRNTRVKHFAEHHTEPATSQSALSEAMPTTSDATQWTTNVSKWQRDDGDAPSTPRTRRKASGAKPATYGTSDGLHKTAGDGSSRGAQGRVPLQPLHSRRPVPQPAEEPDADAPEVAIHMQSVVEPPPTPRGLVNEASSLLTKAAPTSKSNSIRSQAIRMMERSPLLKPQDSIANDPEWGFREAVEIRPDLKTEFQSLCDLSYPVIFTYVLEFLPGIVSMTLVGHMDSPLIKEYVDGVSLSTMFMNLTGVAFGFGLATAMDTLCSQAYGAGKPMKMGIYFQSGVLVLGFTIIPVFLLNWYTDRFLLMMGQPPEVAELAGRFSRLILPGIPFLYIYELFKKLLQAQNVVKPMVYIAVLSNIVNVVLGVYLTWYTSWGYDGAAIARTISNVVLPGSLIPLFLWNPDIARQWWPGWKLSEAIRHLKTFLTLGIPGMFMMLLEWWAFEIMAVFVGWLPDSIVAISVHSVLSNVSTMTFNFFLGISVATNIRVGNYVGANQPEHAKLASALGMALVLLVSTALAVVLLFTRNVVPAVFINDSKSIALAAHAILFLLPYQMLDAINCVMQGVFRGTGRQGLAAYINLFGYFAIGIPFGVFLAFNLEFGVEGLWLGLTAGVGVGVAISLVKILFINWEETADAARVRTS
ncbi:hypothetical protein P43SY_006257 [Pythium insidiosum]|uniref:Multidrug/Oligosaccharidyl-lipid/Polysaccharide (MOP) Flippase Superfamily n=1 Tax=Pythium insidiosum TaxID=114742 RepID=A0AAD5Q9H6_PYTIN|nr:hypothetical protein P43SY_006257 [Pythium insidiosum]